MTEFGSNVMQTPGKGTDEGGVVHWLTVTPPLGQIELGRSSQLQLPVSWAVVAKAQHRRTVLPVSDELVVSSHVETAVG